MKFNIKGHEDLIYFEKVSNLLDSSKDHIKLWV